MYVHKYTDIYILMIFSRSSGWMMCICKHTLYVHGCRCSRTHTNTHTYTPTHTQYTHIHTTITHIQTQMYSYKHIHMHVCRVMKSVKFTIIQAFSSISSREYTCKVATYNLIMSWRLANILPYHWCASY